MIHVHRRKLGTGTYGTVYIGKWNGRRVAVKCFNCKTSEDGIDVGILRELVYLKTLPRHPNIVEILAIDWTGDTIQAALPLYKRDLSKFLKSRKPQSCQICLDFSIPLLRGLKHLHDAGIFHRDVKPSNILLDDNNIPVLCDFSLASACESRINHSFTVQSLWYRAPEIMLGKNNYGTEVDIWSFGCVLGALMKGVDICRGACDIDQLYQYFELFETPNPTTWTGIERLKYYGNFWPKFPGKDLFVEFPQLANEHIRRLFLNSICYDPELRWSAQQLLA